MPTGTKTHKPVLKELAQRESALAELADKATGFSRELKAAIDKERELTDARRRLIYNEPELVDHRGVPVADDNPVAMTDRRLAVLPDIGDLQAQTQHAEAIRRRGEQSLGDWRLAHSAELTAAFKPEADALRTAALADLDQAHAAVAAYLGAAQRYEYLSGERCRALDTASDLVQVLGDVNLLEIDEIPLWRGGDAHGPIPA